MAPTPGRHRLLHEGARARARGRTASANGSAPAATQRRVLAERVAGHDRRASSRSGNAPQAAEAATECVRMAGCVLAVSFSSSSGPSKQSVRELAPSAASAAVEDGARLRERVVQGLAHARRSASPVRER